MARVDEALLMTHRINIFQTHTGLPDTCTPQVILKFMKYKSSINKDDLIPQDIIDTISSDISDDYFT